MSILRSAILTTVASILATAPINFATAAEIDSTRLGNGREVIFVIGEVKAGDEEKFRDLSLKFPDAVIAFDSPGGAVRPALEIGRLISLRSYPTVVLDKGICASACALMWLAGVPRFLEPGGRLGFHASYRDVDGRRIESGVANALVGHYLSQLNLSQRAVIFATSASPDDITWLTERNRVASGIDFENFVPSQKAVSSSASTSTGQAVAGRAPASGIIAANAVLRNGTEIPLRVSEELTTKGKKLRVGNRFRLETSEPVIVQGVTVIPVGSPAVGEITDVRNKGMWGKSGHLTARLLYVTANGRQIRLSGAFDDKGVAGGIGATAVAAIVFLPAGFFMTGTSAKIPMGTVVKGFIDEDVPLAIPSEVQTMVIGAPSAPMSVGTAPTAAAPATVAVPAEAAPGAVPSISSPPPPAP